MTEITNLVAGVDHIIGYEIAKDMTRADRAVVRSYFLSHAEEHENVSEFVESLILRDVFPLEAFGDPGPGAPVTKPDAQLSIKVEDGRNLYMIRLANEKDGPNHDTRAKWGAGGPPLGFLPENIYGANKPIKQMALALEAQGRVRYIPEAAIPARLPDVPNGAWILFRCDAADMKKFWSDLGYEADHDFIIPFRYNLFDRQQSTPIWNVDHSHGDDDHDHDAASNKAVATHGGIHPGGAKGTLTHGGIHPKGLLGILTHGGIHPGVMPRDPFMIVRGRTHGGIHPGSLVEYFYYESPKPANEPGPNEI